MSGDEPKVYREKRDDRYYQTYSVPEALFQFGHDAGDAKTESYTEEAPEDFDFEAESAPFVFISPRTLDGREDLPAAPGEMLASVIVEDLWLHESFLYFQETLSALDDEHEIQISLREIRHLEFTHGYKITCLLTPPQGLKDPGDGSPWHKSHIIAEKSFTHRSLGNDGLFSIHWSDFPTPEKSQDLFYSVEWRSQDVLEEPISNCLTVYGNDRLKRQFQRAERHQIGKLAIYLMVIDIVSDIAINTLRLCSPDTPPQEGSAADAVFKLLARIDPGFNPQDTIIELKKQTLGTLTREGEIRELIQQEYSFGTELEQTRFSGMIAK